MLVDRFNSIEVDSGVVGWIMNREYIDTAFMSFEKSNLCSGAVYSIPGQAWQRGPRSVAKTPVQSQRVYCTGLAPTGPREVR